MSDAFWGGNKRRYATASISTEMLIKAAGVREEIKSMDFRAGGISEAKALGVDQYTLRDAAQHTQISTTDRYARGRSESANKVVQLRQSKR